LKINSLGKPKKSYPQKSGSPTTKYPTKNPNPRGFLWGYTGGFRTSTHIEQAEKKLTSTFQKDKSQRTLRNKYMGTIRPGGKVEMAHLEPVEII